MHEKYMKRALDLSKKGIGYTNPNPLVGAVIVKDGDVIGEGYHEYYGGSHAEVNALSNSNINVKGATMYVTLEPCSHFGKTPPCAEAIVRNNISKVVLGMLDPNPLVSGKGIEILKNAGIEVITGILDKEIKQLNEVYVKYITTKTPFLILKTAMTLDGKIATVTGESKWITGEKSREYVHELRHSISSIMVGIGTILADNPSLTTRRNDQRGKDPVRIIVDSHARIPQDARLFSLDTDVKTIIATTQNASENHVRSLSTKGVDIITTPVKNGQVDLYFLMKELGSRGIDSVLLEGGSELNFSVINEGIVDKVLIFISPKIVGGHLAKTPVGGAGIQSLSDAIILDNIQIKQFDKDIMIEGYTRR